MKHEKDIERAVWKFVAKENDDALATFFDDGSVEAAFSKLDSVRDEGLNLLGANPALQNEIECRRLEMRIFIAFEARDYLLISSTLQEAGKSERFSAERLHYLLGVIGGHIRNLGESRT